MNTEITVPKLNTYFDIEQYYLKNRLDVPGVEAMARLAIVAHYLNGGWIDIGEKICFLRYFDNEIAFGFLEGTTERYGIIPFKDTATAFKALEILGEETIIAALTIGS